MRSIVSVLTAVSLGAALASSPLQAQSSGSTAGAQRISACSLIPTEEVKQHLPWLSFLDSMPIEEDVIGASGSGCNYPSVYIQVLPFSQSTMDQIRGKGALETISGVGDEAYLYNNAGEYAELYVKAGEQMLTLQANMDGDIEVVKSGVLALAKVLVDKLP